MTGPPPGAPPTLRLHPASPILRVSDLDASVRWYVARLGFRLDWQTPGVIASVSRDGANLMLCEGDQGHAGGWAYIGASDAARLHAEFVSLGATIRLPPTNYPWALETHVQDPDGNVLRFGSEPRAGEPCGDWLDMNGVWWTPAGAGRWRRRESGGESA
jgi:catechol 2,3-dioxygenase-like lactoylglutathione lyase family enzyme